MSGDGKRIADAVIPHAERGDVPGLAWAVAIGDELHQGAAGRLRVDGDEPVRLDTIFRISSMTKPVLAAAALQLVDDGTLALPDPVEELLPELADRRVLAPGATSLDDTVPAARPITVHDVLTFRLGWGMDFTDWGPNPVLDAAAALGLGAGPPSPQAKPAPDEWLRRLATLPLQRQPGERWLYHLGADVLGVLMARASGQPLEQLLQERIIEPLGMVDTGFAVPAADLDRSGPCYGWAGGLGSSWANDPATGVVGVLMTNQMWTSPVPPPVVTDFWTAIVAR